MYDGLLGAAPCEVNGGMPYHDGTIAPYGAISCMPFMRTSEDELLEDNLSFNALRNYYQKYYTLIWGTYGPKDSFNDNGEFCNTYLGISLGPIVLMIENYRTGFVWNNFMKNAKVLAAANKVFGYIP